MVVRFVTDAAFAQWLETEWESCFEWDAANTEKLAKHDSHPLQSKRSLPRLRW